MAKRNRKVVVVTYPDNMDIKSISDLLKTKGVNLSIAYLEDELKRANRITCKGDGCRTLVTPHEEKCWHCEEEGF